MKKILALIVAVVMMFSIAVVPASATVAESGQAVVDSYNAGDYEAAIANVFTFVNDFIASIHNLVGNIMAVLEKECVFCDTLHVLEA